MSAITAAARRVARFEHGRQGRGRALHAKRSAERGPSRLNSSSTIPSIAIGTGRIPVYHCALAQTSALAIIFWRTGLQCRYSIMDRSVEVRVPLRSYPAPVCTTRWRTRRPARPSEYHRVLPPAVSCESSFFFFTAANLTNTLNADPCGARQGTKSCSHSLFSLRVRGFISSIRLEVSLAKGALPTKEMPWTSNAIDVFSNS